MELGHPKPRLDWSFGASSIMVISLDLWVIGFYQRSMSIECVGFGAWVYGLAVWIYVWD